MTNPARRVSVLMASFNCGRYLPSAIESVLAQSYPDLELVIIDDCSTDGSREIAQEWRRIDDRVITVFHESNRGISGARNSGFAASSGDFIAFCDADDIWAGDKLESQLESFTRQSDLGVVHSDALIMDSKGKLTGQRYSSLFHGVNQRCSGMLFDEFCRRNFVCTSTVILRRECLKYAGGFEQRLRSLEDWICWVRVSTKHL